jgi:hypothetical protein
MSGVAYADTTDCRERGIDKEARRRTLTFPSSPLMVLVTIELLAVVALLRIAAWQPEARGRHIRRLTVVLWGTTAFCLIHIFTEYMIMTCFSRWIGFGYLTAATITISAILTTIMTIRTPRRGADDVPHHGHHSGSLTLA